MIELRGKYNYAYVYADSVDNESASQIIELLNQPAAEGRKIRIMPDVHPAAGCTVGTTMTVKDKAIPDLVGTDIGCGMEVTYLAEKEIDFEKLDEVIRRCVPAGAQVRRRAHKFGDMTDLSQLKCAKHIQTERAKLSLGTLGGGNHFIEVDRSEDGTLLLVVHSGSRRLGVETARYYRKAALEQCVKTKAEMMVLQLKLQGREEETEKELKRFYQSRKIPERLAYCEGQLLEDYLHDMKIVQKFAQLNRKAITQTILSECDLTETDCFTTVHNYIDTENMILRKGAVSAQKGERLIIPMNMRDGALICVGKGNPDWNFSAPHGAGRAMNRAQAKAELSVDEFRREMKGVYSTSVGQSTVDESPMAYKPMRAITDNIFETAEIKEIVKPVYNFKSGGANN